MFLVLLWCWLGVRHGTAQRSPSEQSLGNAQASRARAHRFLAGRDLTAPSPLNSGVPTPAAQRASALRAAAVLPRPADVANLTSAWTPLGPASVSSLLYGAITGRVTSLALDPNDSTGNTLYLGTTGGGVWKSTTAAGATSSVQFTPLTDTLPVFSANAGTAAVPSLSIGAVAVQPAPNPVILAGTGDPNDATDSYYGEGIVRSLDGGQSWTLANESNDGTNGHRHFNGLATAGLAWSTTTPTLAVAAMSTALEAGTVAAAPADAVPGLYFSTDAGATWQMATVMDGAQYVQTPANDQSNQVGASATSVVWSAQRGMFFAAIQFHGYYSSTDGQTWTRLTHQPGTGLTSSKCPVLQTSQGSVSCPVFRGTLAVQPATGDLYALSVDVNELDQGLWQDLCNADSTGKCASAAPSFPNRLDAGALEEGQGAPGKPTDIPQGSYNLALLAAPAPAKGTILFAGTIDLYRCTLAAGATSCSFRNTTNAGNACNATSAVAPAQHALVASSQTNAPIIFLGNDGGLWRSTDGVAQTGPACAQTDAAHFQNLNPAIGTGGSLAEVVGFAQDPSQNDTLIAGLGTDGTAATSTAGTTSPWPQLSSGEGGFPQIDPVAPANWFIGIGAGVNVRACTSGVACGVPDFSGSADIGAIQTQYDAALLDAPILLDPQNTSSLITATCRVWRGPTAGGSAWNATNALSPALDGGSTPCSVSSALIRSLGAGGPVATSGTAAARGSEVLYAGMAGNSDGGGTLPGHLFVSKTANTAASTGSWIDVTGSPVTNSHASFNASGFDLSSVVVDSHDSTGATVYATVMGFGVPHVYRSTDFGAHWLNLTANLPDAPVNSLVVDPNDANTVYIGSDVGVYATQAIATCSSQSCWSLLGSALPNAPVTQLQAGAGLAIGDGRIGILRAATYGRGIWQTPLLTAHNLLQPQLSTSPASLTFLAQQVGTQSDVLTVNVLSYGNAPATISSIVVTGDFVETNTCTGQPLAVNANCTVSVRFAPTATGGRSGLLTIYANVPGGQVTVPLTGTGNAAAAVVLTPLQLNFASTLVNQTSQAQIVTISNTGQTPATMQGVTISGDFILGANTCGSSLPAQVGCSVSILFSPKGSGTRTGVLTVVDSAGTQTAQLSGTGQSPATDTLTPASLTFSQQQVGTSSAAQQVTLTNAGDVQLTLISAAILSGDFQATNSCGTSLAAHSSCAINVIFTPSATGTRTGTLQITDQFRSQTVGLSGAGLAPAGVSLSPSTLDFGTIGVGLNASASTVLLTNNGGMPLTLGKNAITGDFTIAATTCGATLLPGDACNLSVVFSPTLAGSRTGMLTVNDNVGTGSQTVTLNGTGLDFSLSPDGQTSVTVNSGSVATFPLLMTSATGLSGGVPLTCTGAPANAVCTVNPATVQLGSTVPVSVTVQTGVSLTGHNNLPAPGGRSTTVMLCFLGALLAPLHGRARRRQLSHFLARSLAIFALSLGLSAITGCGATRLIPVSGTGSGGGAGTGSASQPTVPGTYALHVSGTLDGVTHAVDLSLIVK